MLLGAVCIGLAMLPAIGGFVTGRSLRPSASPPVSPSSSPPPSPSFVGLPSLSDAAPSSAPGFAGAIPPGAMPPGVMPPGATPPGAGAPGSEIAATSAVPGSGSAWGEPVGWKLSDIPVFPPRPAPEPIVLPEGDEVPFLSRVPVTQPVAFLTIDDGFLKNPEAPKLFAAAGIPITLFLTTDAIQDDVPFFDNLRNYGAVIEAHTISHPELRGRGYGFQHHQICDGTDRLQKWYGRRPVLFRPPFGDKDSSTLRVAKECGIKAAFMWRETVDKGIVRYQAGKKIQPGDIVLMHFRPAFVKDFIAALRAIHNAGLTPALLEDYVPGANGAPTVAPGRVPGSQD